MCHSWFLAIKTAREPERTAEESPRDWLTARPAISLLLSSPFPFTVNVRSSFSQTNVSHQRHLQVIWGAATASRLCRHSLWPEEQQREMGAGVVCCVHVCGYFGKKKKKKRLLSVIALSERVDFVALNVLDTALSWSISILCALWEEYYITWQPLSETSCCTELTGHYQATAMCHHDLPVFASSFSSSANGNLGAQITPSLWESISATINQQTSAVTASPATLRSC